jgi:hypothetical protein
MSVYCCEVHGVGLCISMCWKVYQAKADPQMVDCTMGEKSWLKLRLCACIAGTKTSAVVCQRENTCLHDAFIFPSKNINEITVFFKI